MKKFIRVLLLVRKQPVKEVEIEATEGLHELEIYTILEQMFPAYIFVNLKVDEKVYQEGYNVEYKNELYAVAIYRSNV